ncbi:hypothetical protein GALMADRAFT_144789 [Galerina marginata CBS 339.88]|uniref:Terpene synthase n=1 Tax=Galerina marginata (strain CBS 339.88) TaxID=685588 RepID=A0A067SS78_GALM3|nr:hypothetical protein GALMADRAFT_144789 [Galerina marginata CBS 339.88]
MLKNVADITSRAWGPGKVNTHGDKFQLSRPFASAGPPRSVLPNNNALLPGYRRKAHGDLRGQHVDDTLLHAVAKPDHMKSLVDTYVQALYHENFSSPNPYAMMSYHSRGSVSTRIKTTATPGNCTRYRQGFEEYLLTGLSDAGRRSQNKIPSVSEYLLLRRACVGATFTWSHVEYALDINLPDFAFNDSIFIDLSIAAADIMAWQNDLVSFNKEQAGDEYLNFVCSIMVEKRIELQEAIDTVVAMTETRVGEYVKLKTQLPVFGPGVDSEVARYFAGIEKLLQGGIVWSYWGTGKFAWQLACLRRLAQVLRKYSQALAQTCATDSQHNGGYWVDGYLSTTFKAYSYAYKHWDLPFSTALEGTR